MLHPALPCLLPALLLTACGGGDSSPPDRGGADAAAPGDASLDAARLADGAAEPLLDSALDGDDIEREESGAALHDATVSPDAAISPDGAAADASPRECGAGTFSAQEQRPDVLVVLDRSLSMVQNQRWEPTTLALKTFASGWQYRLQFGLQLFPGVASASMPLACHVGPLDVACRIEAGNAITSAINAATPMGQTPTGGVLQKALEVLGNRTASADAPTPRPAFVLLLTDGIPGCALSPAGAPDQAEIDRAKEAIRALSAASIPTYVVGYQIDPPQRLLMNELAVLGGTGSYREVASQPEVTDVLQTLAVELISCELRIDLRPEDKGQLHASMDAAPLLLDDPNGWRYQDGHVLLQGSACSTFKRGMQHDVFVDNRCSP